MTGIAVRHRQRVVDAARNQWDLKHIGIHRRDGEQPDETMLDHCLSRLFTDHHDVGVRAVAQVARHGGLREDQQIVAGGQLRKHVGAQPKHAETTGWIDGGLAVADLAALVTQHYEVPVCQPAQQRADIPAVRAGEPALGVGVEFGRQADQHGRHRRGVQRHLTGLGENTRQEALDLIHRLGVDRIGELHVDPCLVDAIAEWRIGRRLDRQ